MGKSILQCSTIICTLLYGGPALAGAGQDAGSAAMAPATSGDIIVTARRRDESLSKVPVAVSVLGSEAIAQKAIRSDADLQIAVPGLTVKQGGSSNILSFAIRGQSVDLYTSSPPAVLPYVNEFQVANNSASSFFDLENIQVLKGPQGTLFGRNTTGGAILYTTAQPGDEAKGLFTVRAGNYETYQVTAAATVPLAPWASLRVAGNWSDGGDYVRNLFTNKDVGGNTNKTIRATLRIGERTGLKSTTTIQYGTDRGTNTPGLVYAVNAPGATSPQGIPLFSAPAAFFDPANPVFQALLAARPELPAEGLLGYLQTQRARGPWTASVDSDLTHTGENLFVLNTTEIPLSDDLTIKNIIGWNRSTKTDMFEYDGTPYPIFGTSSDGQSNMTSQFSEELQLQGKLFDGKMTFVIGAYYSNQRDEVFSGLSFFDLAPIAPGTIFTYRFLNKDKSYAGFAQATYNLTDQLHLTGGFRYSKDEITGQNLPGSVYGVTQQEASYKKPSWTVSLDYQLTPELLLYVSQRGSWRAGGFNFTAVPINLEGAGGGNIFRPETTKDVEVGAKFNGRAGGMPLTLNIAAYNQWVDNIQRAAFQVINGNPGLVTSNVPKAEVTGFEGDVTARPAPWLELGMSGAYTDARFTDNVAVSFGTPVPFGPYGDTPKWSGSAFAQLTAELGGGAGSLSLRGEVYGQTSFYFSNTASSLTPDTRIPGYSLTNLRLSWNDLLGTDATLAFYVTNLFKKEHYVGGLPAGNAAGESSVSPGRPRMFGGEMRFNF